MSVSGEPMPRSASRCRRRSPRPMRSSLALRSTRRRPLVTCASRPRISSAVVSTMASRRWVACGRWSLAAPAPRPMCLGSRSSCRCRTGLPLLSEQARIGVLPSRAPLLIWLAASRFPRNLRPTCLAAVLICVAARLRAEAAASRVGQARAAFYPNINLTAFIGVQSLTLDMLTKDGSSIGKCRPRAVAADLQRRPPALAASQRRRRISRSRCQLRPHAHRRPAGSGGCVDERAGARRAAHPHE